MPIVPEYRIMDNSLLSPRAVSQQSIWNSSGIAHLAEGNGVVQAMFTTAGNYVQESPQPDRSTARVIWSP